MGQRSLINLAEYESARRDVETKERALENAKLDFQGAVSRMTATERVMPTYLEQSVMVSRLEERVAKLEAMLAAAGYNAEQIAAGTPYVEVMGT